MPETAELRPTLLEAEKLLVPERDRSAWQCQTILDALGKAGRQIVVGDWSLEWLEAPVRCDSKGHIGVRHVVEGRLNSVLVFRDAIQQWDRPPILRRSAVNYHKEVRDWHGERREVIVPNAEDDPLGATLDDLLHTIWVCTSGGRAPWLKDKPGTVSTFYSAAATDGSILSQNAVWATARSGGTLSVNPGAAATYSYLGTSLFLSVYYGIISLHAFDSSAIPDTDTISAAVVSLYGQGYNDNETSTLQGRLTSDYTAGGLTTADWISGASFAALTLLATFTHNSWSTAAYNDFASDAAFPANVSKTGLTCIVFCNNLFADNTAPTTDGTVQPFNSDQAGTANDPKLVVTHAAGASLSLPPPRRRNTMAGLICR